MIIRQKGDVVEIKGLLETNQWPALKSVVSLDGPAGYEQLPVPEHTPGWETFWIDDFLAGREPAVSAREAK